ncbi:uncharacterized protein [Henckelia pumila]|uniref:uncharacterized protein n=1 Tax=Henckelia pumila TaxID=405737 RepID=UPI003C6E5355
MATLKEWHNIAPLQVLAETNSLFLSGESLSWWQSLIYSCEFFLFLIISIDSAAASLIYQASLFRDSILFSNIILEPEGIALEPTSRKHNDIEKSLSSGDQGTKFGWSEVVCRVPCVKSIKDKKVMHQQALELAKLLCERTAILPHSEAEPIYGYSIIKAAHHGIHEVVEVIIEMFPSAVFVHDPHTKSSIFLLAARERLENVFSLIYKTNDKKHFFFDSRDSSWNNVMHLCAKIAPPHKLNLVSGAALQMQRELQWFEEMKKFVNPSRRTWKNKDGLTPRMLFTKEHKELKEQGEKWMKETATSCTIAAALIATVVFSAAFTVPGSVNSDTGIPTLLHKTSFILFTISDSVSLFTSTTSLLIFLSILTSRYAEEDFLYVLPKRLCMGLISLFTSITFMMIAFTIAIYITLQQKSRLLLIPVALLACLPVATFVFLQFPLLIAVLYSTYGPGIFGRKSGHTPY